MATEGMRVRSGFERYAWTVFVAMGALLVLLGVGDMFGADTSLKRENSLNEVLIGLFGVAIAVYGVRRGERWAWYAMLLWVLWSIAQSWRAWSAGKTGEAATLPVILILILAALALSYRRSFARERP
ncbi:MAG: hypothetical protein PVS2B1_18050 [Candidatus Dormibacteraceae bacterium]